MMANPQIENGHTVIANEILDALCQIRIPGEAMQVLLVIIRKTYGWKKKCDRISLSQFVEMTGQNKGHIVRSIRKLESMNMIVVTQKGNRSGHLYSFIKNFDKWKPLPKKATYPKKATGSTPKRVPQKKERKRTSVFSEIDMKGAKFLYAKIREHSPHVNKKEHELESWANTFRLMVERDGRTVEQITAAIKYATQDDFWKANILSADKVRKHMDTLLTQLNSRGN